MRSWDINDWIQIVFLMVALFVVGMMIVKGPL